jgi:hypothetical protein
MSTKQKKPDYHGRVPFTALDEQGESIRVRLNFAQAMQLSLAIQDCLMALNRHDRTTKPGKELGMSLAFYRSGNYAHVVQRRVSSDD